MSIYTIYISYGIWIEYTMYIVHVICTLCMRLYTYACACTHVHSGVC